MTTILRNQNTNKIKVIFFSKPKFIRKVCENKKYFRYLKYEKEGLAWYNSRIKRKNNVLDYINSKNFSYIDLKFSEGQKKKFYNSIIENGNILLRAINHYVSAWPQKKIVKCHGDLTLDNIIYNKYDIKFIDWELSGLSKEVWGYDLVYLIISSVFFSYNIKKKINKKERKIFNQIWSKFFDLDINNKLLLNPISYFLNVYKKKNWKYAIRDHPNKIYPISINEEFNQILESMIS